MCTVAKSLDLNLTMSNLKINNKNIIVGFNKSLVRAKYLNRIRSS